MRVTLIERFQKLDKIRMKHWLVTDDNVGKKRFQLFACCVPGMKYERYALPIKLFRNGKNVATIEIDVQNRQVEWTLRKKLVGFLDSMAWSDDIGAGFLQRILDIHGEKDLVLDDQYTFPE